MRVFVTGATGVIGRRVVPLLQRHGHQVTALARPGAKSDALERCGVAVRDVSLFDRRLLAAAMSGHDAVMNLATHVPHSMLGAFLPGAWRETDRIRRDGSASVVDAALAAGVKRLVQESFAPIYESRGDTWIDEESPVLPARHNRTTLDAERSARRFADAGGIGVVLRFADFYGPDSSQLQAMIGLVRRGWAPLPGPAGSFIPSVAHDDAASAVVAALALPSGIYNVTDDEPLRHREFVDALADAVGVAHPRLFPAWMAALAGSVGRTLARSLRVSNRKLRDAAGWTPRYRSVREGFAAAVPAAAS